MPDNLTLSQAWVKLQRLGDRKPAYSIARANIKGHFDFPSKDDTWYRITSIGRGEVYSVRKL